VGSHKPNQQPYLLTDFPIQTLDKIRYADTDRQGHVNNAVFSTYLETGRVEFLYDPKDPLANDNCEFVIASLHLNFLSEITWPGRLDIGTGVTRVGTSSFGLYQVLFQDEICVATAETTIVQMDVSSRKSAPLCDATRHYLNDHLFVKGVDTKGMN
jgi:acyl-CoA thioester hydrolase